MSAIDSVVFPADPLTTVSAFAIAGHSVSTPSNFTGLLGSTRSRRRPSAETSGAGPPPFSVSMPWDAAYSRQPGSDAFSDADAELASRASGVPAPPHPAEVAKAA